MSDQPKNSIVVRENGSMFVGPDAVHVYQAAVIREALQVLKSGRRLNRAYTRGNTLIAAGRITGQTYTWRAVDRAIADLTDWIDATRSQIHSAE